MTKEQKSCTSNLKNDLDFGFGLSFGLRLLSENRLACSVTNADGAAYIRGLIPMLFAKIFRELLGLLILGSLLYLWRTGPARNAKRGRIEVFRRRFSIKCFLKSLLLPPMWHSTRSGIRRCPFSSHSASSQWQWESTLQKWLGRCDLWLADRDLVRDLTSDLLYYSHPVFSEARKKGFVWGCCADSTRCSRGQKMLTTAGSSIQVYIYRDDRRRKRSKGKSNLLNQNQQRTFTCFQRIYLRESQTYR